MIWFRPVFARGTKYLGMVPNVGLVYRSDTYKFDLLALWRFLKIVIEEFASNICLDWG